MVKQVRLLLACLFAASASLRVLPQDELQSLAKDIRSSVVLITTYGNRGNVLGRGSGFIISETGQVLTRKSLLPTERTRTEARTSDGRIYKVIGIANQNKEADLAIVTVDLSNHKLKPLTVSSSLPVVGERVFTINGSGEAEQAITVGTVEAVRDDQVGKIVQIAGRVAADSGGSPVINMKGEVIGVVKFEKAAEATFSCDAGESLLRLVRDRLEPPRLLNNPEPSYTLQARRHGVEGDVAGRVLIGADGKVKQVMIIRGLPDGLDDEAIKAAYKMKFRPAMKNGQPVAFWKAFLIEFRLRR